VKSKIAAWCMNKVIKMDSSFQKKSYSQDGSSRLPTNLKYRFTFQLYHRLLVWFWGEHTISVP